MIFKYCAECGHKLEDIKCGDDDCKICPSCNKIYGSSPFPVVEVLVVNEFNEILPLEYARLALEGNLQMWIDAEDSLEVW